MHRVLVHRLLQPLPLYVLGCRRVRADLERLHAHGLATAGETDQERLTAVKRGVFKYPAHANLSPEATSFINGLLCKFSFAHTLAFAHRTAIPCRCPSLFYVPCTLTYTS